MSERYHHPGHAGPRHDRGRASFVLLAALACAALLAAGAALLAACGGSSGGAEPSVAASPSATPVPSPQITSGAPPAAAVEVVRAFWAVVGDGRLAEARQDLVAPGSPLAQWSGDDIASARFVRVVPSSVSPDPPDGATIAFGVTVWIEAADPATPWNDRANNDLFESVVKMSDGTWRMWSSGTSP